MVYVAEQLLVSMSTLWQTRRCSSVKLACCQRNPSLSGRVPVGSICSTVPLRSPDTRCAMLQAFPGSSIYIYTYISIYMCTHTYTYRYACLYICMYICIYTCVYIHVHMRICTGRAAARRDGNSLAAAP